MSGSDGAGGVGGSTWVGSLVVSGAASAGAAPISPANPDSEPNASAKANDLS
jgi:hypothetical protein